MHYLIFASAFFVNYQMVAFWNTGNMSWYGEYFHGRTTASGSIYDMNKLTVAHRTLPFGTVVEFYYKGKIVRAVVTDRGPFVAGRDWDASRELFRQLTGGRLDRGVIGIRYRVVGQICSPSVRQSGAIPRTDVRGYPHAPRKERYATEFQASEGRAAASGVSGLGDLSIDRGHQER